MKKDISLHLKRASMASRLLNMLLHVTNVRMRSVFIGKGSILRSDTVEIGFRTRINGKIRIKGTGVVSIGKYCAIGDDVRIISSNHSLDAAAVQLALQKRVTGATRVMSHKLGVTVGHDVWIGDAAILLPGVKIGNGAVVGAGSVVTHSVGTYVVVAGNPARPIGRRFSESVAGAIHALQWWNWNDRQFRQAAFLFSHAFSDQEDSEALGIIERARLEAANYEEA